MMIQRQHILAAVMLLTASVLAACSSSALPVLRPATAPDLPAAATGKKVPVHVRIFIPRRRHRDVRSMRPFFVANSTRGIAVIVSAHGSSTPLSTTNASVAASSPLCKSVTGGRECTIGAAAPPGNDDFTIKTYDAAPAKGGFSGAKQLAYGLATTNISGGKANSLKVTVGGVVAKSAVHLAWPVNPVIDPDTQGVTVSALDADGNTIVNDGWYSASGATVKMAMSASNGATGTFAFSATTVTFASPTTKLTYASSKATPAQVKSGFTSAIAATPDNGATAGSATFTLSKPSITEFGTSSSSSYPHGIVVGPDKALWFAECLAGKIGRLTTSAASGTTATEYNLPSGLAASPQMLAVDATANHNLWVTEFGNNKVAKVDPASVSAGTSNGITEYPTPNSNDSPFGIVLGPDNDLWFASNGGSNKIITFAPSLPTSMVQYNAPDSGSYPQMIAAGADGALYFTETQNVNKIGRITTDGGTITTVSVPLASGTGTIYEGAITPGPDGALWFAECNNVGNKIGRVTTGTSGTVNDYGTGMTAAANPLGIVTGPDGALWFTENGNNAIGRIDPATHIISEFVITSFGGSSGSVPYGIVKGPDGAIWFTEEGTGKIAKLK